jgi:ribosomal protein S18 acetylase RimI-like enzyme
MGVVYSLVVFGTIKDLPQQFRIHFRRMNSMIRQYADNDWAAICCIYDAAKPIELSCAGIEESFVPLALDHKAITRFKEHKIFVFESMENGTILGFAGHRGAFISWLFVAPQHSREGVGTQLIRYLLDQIKQPAWLWALKENVPALDLYQKEHFKITDQRPTNNLGLPCTAVKLEYMPPLSGC